jgi:hypothetical protein
VLGLLLLACGGGSTEANQQPPAAPVIVTFTAGQNPITVGTSTLLTSTFTGGTGVIDHGVGTITSGIPISSGPVATDTTFLLTVNGEGGTITQTLTVQTALASTFPAITAPATVAANQSGYTASSPLVVGLDYQWTISGGSIEAGNGTAEVTFSAGPAGILQLACITRNAANAQSLQSTVSIPISAATAAALPVIAAFSASPNTIYAGQTSTLAWAVTGASSLSLDLGIGTVTGTSTTASPIQTSTYTLTATNSAGSALASATVSVLAQGGANPPVISAFVASPAVVMQGQPCALSWVVVGAANLSLEDLNSGVTTAVTGSGISIPVNAGAGSDAWLLTATNSSGSTSASAYVNVTN